MAAAPEVVRNDREIPDEKLEYKSSSTDLSKGKYVLDNAEDGYDIYDQANPARPGFTKSDQKDMWRMGRIQEFKVRFHLQIIGKKKNSLTVEMNSEIIVLLPH
jgi:hypothetical protein